jgi:MoaA/NifB/PqqE/SkfB family radical SAM enzyme
MDGNGIKAKSSGVPGLSDFSLPYSGDEKRPVTAMENAPPQINRVCVCLTGPCNYRCYYCYVGRKRLDSATFGRFATSEGVRKLVAVLDLLGKSSVSLVGGGETMLLPNFIDVCAAIAQRHQVGITTNFSTPIEPFMEAVRPEKVSSFVISLHPEGEKDLEGLKKRVLTMKQKNYPTMVVYVAHPLRLKNIPDLYRFFSDHDIDFRIAPFNGEYRGASYPAAYTRKETAFLLPFTVDPVSRYSLEGGKRRHKGKLCFAGYSSFIISEKDGGIRRCADIPRILGNVFEGTVAPLSRPAPCTAPYCTCDFSMEELVFLRKYYAGYSGMKLPPVSDRTMTAYRKICRPLNRRGAIR